MSAQPDQSSGGQPADSEGRFSTLIGSLAAATSAGRAVPDDHAGNEAGSRVRRAPAPDVSAPADVPPAPVATVPVPAVPTPATPALPAPPAEEATRALPLPAAAAATATDEPLLGDVAALRARWQRVQASFVDGPQEAVSDAADLIEQTAQALVGALRQRQRQLRVRWESGAEAASSDGEPASREPDTEHLRLMMQHYRALFNQLCRS